MCALAVVALIVSLSSCKRGTDICSNNSHLENGACVCNDGWFGWHCERNAATECGPHAHGVENWCVCDTGWTGDYCNIPIGRFAGRYHVTGSSSSFMGGSSTPPTSIDDIVDVVVKNDTIYFLGYNHTYKAYGADTSKYYPFIWTTGSPSNYSILTFRKQLDDSLFYNSRSGGLGAGTFTNLKGVKLN